MLGRKKGIALSYINTFVAMACGLFLSSFLLRSLGDTEYGVYQTISSFANYLVLLEFGVGTVLTRNISVCRGNNEGEETIGSAISTLWIITLVLAGIITALSIFFYFSIESIYYNSLSVDQIEYAKNIFIIVSIHLIFSFFSQTLKGIALGYEKYSFSAYLSLIRNISRTTALVVIICFYKYAIVIAIVDMCLSALLFVSSWLYCRRYLKVKLLKYSFNSAVFKQSFILCIAIFLQGIINQANGNVDKFLIGIKLSPESVSLYSVGLYIYTVFSSITTVPISMYAPQVAKEITAGKKGTELLAKIGSASKLTSIIGGSIFFGFISVGRQFISIFYGEQYYLAWTIAIILMGSMYLDTIVGVLENVLDVYNRRIIRSLVLIVTTCANVILTYFLIDRYGVLGATIATSICVLFGQVLAMGAYYTFKLKISVLYLYKEAFNGILPFQVIACVISLVAGHCFEDRIASFVLGGMVYVLVFLTCYLSYHREHRKMALKLLRKFLR